MSEGEWIQARVATKKNTPKKITPKKISTNATKKHIAPVIRKRQNNQVTTEDSNSVGISENCDLLGKNSPSSEKLELIKITLDSHINVKANQVPIENSLGLTLDVSLQVPIDAFPEKPIETSPEKPSEASPEALPEALPDVSLTQVVSPEQNIITNSSSDSQSGLNSRESSINWASHLTDSINSELIDKKYKRYADSYVDPSHIIPVILPKRRPPPSLFDKTYNLIYNHEDNCWDKEPEPPITELDLRFDAYFESIAAKKNYSYHMDDWTPYLTYDSDEYADDDYYSDGEMTSNLDYDT